MRRLVVLSVVLAALFVVFWVWRPISEHDVRDSVHAFGWAAAPAFVVIAGLLGAALVPGPLLAGASGLLFGTWEGFGVTLAATVVSSLVGRSVGAAAGHVEVERVRAHPTLAVVVQRLLPVVPDGPFNYAFGVAGVGAWPLVLGTLIGSSPRAFAYTAIGDGLGGGDRTLVILGGAVVVLTGVVGAALYVRAR